MKIRDDGAQILHKIRHVVVNEDNSSSSTTYLSIRINSKKAARDYGRIALRFNHYYSELELDFANVLTKSGETKPLLPDALQQHTGGGKDFYEDRSALVFSLPEISAGSIMEFQFRSKQIRVPNEALYNDAFSPYWYQPANASDIGRLDPVEQSTLIVTTPADYPLITEEVGEQKVRHKKKSTNGLVRYSWQWKALAKLPVERNVSPDDPYFPKIRLSNTTDWGVIDRWTWSLIEGKFDRDSHIEKLAKSLVAENASKDEKIRAVYNYLQDNVRYVFAHLGRGGYEPHSVSQILNQNYGDCKDQTVLAISLLNALGVDAQPALIATPNVGRPSTDIVALIFDHMLVWIPESDDGPSTFMDTTGDRMLYPGVSNYLLNQPVLLVDGNGGKMTRFSELTAPNSAHLFIEYAQDDRDHIIANIRITTSGYFEQNTRQWWMSAPEPETALRQFIASIYGSLEPDAEMTSSVVNAESLWHPVEVHSKIDLGMNEGPDLSIATGIHQVMRLFMDPNSMQLPDTRKLNWFNEQAIELHVTTKVLAITGKQALVIQSGIDFETEFFRARQSGQKLDGGYEIKSSFYFGELDLPPLEYDNYYAQLNNLNREPSWIVSFKPDETIEQYSSLIEGLTEADAASYIALANHLLSQGKFEQAIEPAEKAVSIDTTNGEAWYVLGTAQGFNANIKESTKSFEKADSLGYIP